MQFFGKNAASKRMLAALYHHYSKVMFGAAYQVLHDRQLAEDAVHTSFEKMLKRQSSLPDDDGSNRTKVFMAIIAKNTALDMLRSRKREQLTSLETEYALEAPDDPLAVILDKESLAKFEMVIDRLPERVADTMRLRYIYDLEIKDIVDLLHITPENVSTRLYRGRNMLLKWMEQEVHMNETEE